MYHGAIKLTVIAALLVTSTGKASIRTCLEYLLQRKTVARGYAQGVTARVGHAFPQAALKTSEFYNVFDGATAERAQIDFWLQASLSTAARRVLEGVDLFRFSEDPRALVFDRESFVGMAVFRNTRRADTFLANLTSAHWALFLDASFQNRFAQSFVRPEVPFGTLSNSADLNRHLRAELEATDIAHADWGMVTVVREKESGQIILGLQSEKGSRRVRLFVPVPEKLEVLRADGNTQLTDLVLLTVDGLPDGTLRLVDAGPVFADDAAFIKSRDRETLLQRDYQMAALELRAMNARAAYIPYSTEFPTLLAWLIRSIDFGLPVRSAQMAIGFGILGGFFGLNNFKEGLMLWGYSLNHPQALLASVGAGAAFGAMVPLLVCARHAYAARRFNLVNDLERAAQLRGELEAVEHEILLARGKLKEESLRLMDADIKRRYVRFDFRFGGATPGRRLYEPSHPDLVPYWRTEQPAMMAPEAQKILSLMQRAESLSLSSAEAQALVAVLTKSGVDYNTAYTEGLKWFALHHPIRRLEDTATFFAPVR